MTKEQEQTEELVKRYIHLLDKQLDNLNSLNGANSGFEKIQKAFTSSIIDCIKKAKDRVLEVKNGAVWDNLVIAFFGETNAGKSTIIETFRILFGEEERTSNLKRNPEGVDGLIVGTGVSDCTQVYKEYKMKIFGVPFTLIDVPGIEGNESLYENEIKNALNKAHFVFYVQGQNKKPDAGTAGKIKKYLREWVKVYSIYNVRGVASNYDEEEERVSLLTDGEKKIERQIQDTFKDVLGSTYMGNISLQAYLALCSKAKFAPSRTDLQRGQGKILKYFGGAESVFAFSQFESLINLVFQKAQNFTKEIVEANKEKHKALLHSMFNEIQNVSEEQGKSICKLENLIKTFQKNVTQDFSASKNYISNISSRKYDLIFSKISDMAMYAISHYVGDKKAYCKRRAEEIISEVANSLQDEIKKEIKSLNSNIKKRKKDLDQNISYASIKGHQATLSFDTDFYGALNKLDFSFGDFGNMILAGISAVGVYFALANIWNPLGWIAAGATFFMWLFGGRDKEAEAKEEMRKNLNKAKAEERQSFNSQIEKIIQALDDSCKDITKAVDKDRVNLKKLRNYVQLIIQSIKTEYSKLNFSEYGKL
ncbi:MAG: 50S ribosome-binding GTPase [Bacteroidaceae bacterium]|nr:50S ribosome-binding GTPase [Bacteroidaceae bacterium]